MRIVVGGLAALLSLAPVNEAIAEWRRISCSDAMATVDLSGHPTATLDCARFVTKGKRAFTVDALSATFEAGGGLAIYANRLDGEAGWGKLNDPKQVLEGLNPAIARLAKDWSEPETLDLGDRSYLIQRFLLPARNGLDDCLAGSAPEGKIGEFGFKVALTIMICTPETMSLEERHEWLGRATIRNG